MITKRSTIAPILDGINPLVRRLAQAETKLWYEHVGKETTGPQFTVLAVLHELGAMDQRTLGAHAHLDKSTAAPLIDRLWHRGLVTVQSDPEDRRRKIIHITQQGRSLVLRLAEGAAQVADRLLARLTPSERTEFIALTRRLVEDEE